MSPVTKGKQFLLSLYLNAEQREALKTLATQSRVPQAVLLREAVDDLLTKYSVKTAPSTPVPRARKAKKAAKAS